MKIKNSEIETSPFLQLDITKKGAVIYCIKLYWTVNPGTHGHQVGAEIFDWSISYGQDGYDDHETLREYKTGGCGYCKKSSGFEHALMMLGYKSKHNAHDALYSVCHVGGNYYKISHTALVKLLKTVKC